VLLRGNKVEQSYGPVKLHEKIHIASLYGVGTGNRAKQGQRLDTELPMQLVLMVS
jgi:hypothetical protein